MSIQSDGLVHFITRTARSGVKGLALIFAALVGVGTVLVEANFMSALILLGSAILQVIAAMEANNGRLYRYPLTIRLIT